MSRLVKLSVGLGVALAAGSSLVPVGVAAPTTTVLTPTIEGWYQPDPTCVLPVGCAGGVQPADPPTVYGARTMRVGVAAGSETARTYLAFDLKVSGGKIRAAVLDVPLSTADGTAAPDLATVVACPWAGTIAAVDGSLSSPPRPDCRNAVEMAYVAEPTPHLHGDLAPLVSSLASAGGLALLPDAEAATPAATWQVAFSAHDRTDPTKTAPAALTLTIDPPSAAVAGDTPAPEAPVVAPLPSGIGFADTAPTVPETTFTPSAVAPSQPSDTAAPEITPAASSFELVGYAYPQVWLLPILFAVVLPLAASALTKDLTPTRPAPATHRTEPS